jgi:rubredoxin---NAD+ reductase
MREMPVSEKVIVVVGAGLAGWSTIREFRKRDASARVVLISADDADFYSKPSLSNAFALRRTLAALVTTPAAEMAANLDVKLLARSRVASIDTEAKTLRVVSEEQGAIELRYTALVLATGAQPVRVEVEGDSDAVMVVNSLEDYRLFHAHVSAKPRRVLIMGAGLIGCEFADDLIVAGHAVQVVDPAPYPLASALPEHAAGHVQEALARAGVRWHLGSTVRKIVRVSDGALDVTLSNGVRCVADAVLSAVGLRPEDRLARDAGIRCDRGVVVDEYLQTSVADVHALGDVAQYASAGNRTLPFVMPIFQAAKALGATLAGARTPVKFPVMPISIKTPSLPAVAALPAPGSRGVWNTLGHADETAWHFVEQDGRQTGFVLLGSQLSRRAEMLRSTAC